MSNLTYEEMQDEYSRYYEFAEGFARNSGYCISFEEWREQWRDADLAVRECPVSKNNEEPPPVSWDEVPDDFKWITRDGDGTIEAWMDDRPSLTGNGIWIGGVGGYRQRCLRLPDDDGQHEPQIWERPE